MVRNEEFAITICVPTGRPEELLIIEEPIASWVAYMFPRQDFKKRGSRNWKEWEIRACMSSGELMSTENSGCISVKEVRLGSD